MTDLDRYYRGSHEYREMLAAQDDVVHAPYVELFRRWAPAGARVLDVGCGVGTSTHLLRAAGFDTAGTDFSAHFLPEEDGFFAADFTRPSPVPPGSFAAIGASNVLEHVARPRTFLTELVRAVVPGGTVILVSPNLTSPLVGLRVLDDLRRGRTPYLGVDRPRDGLALLLRNTLRSTGAAAGRSAFAAREHTLDSGIVGYDVDAVYWTNAAEVRRHLERLGCSVAQFQGAGATAASRLIARRLPSFAGRLLVVAKTAD